MTRHAADALIALLTVEPADHEWSREVYRAAPLDTAPSRRYTPARPPPR